MESHELLIFGAGGFGREVAAWADRARWAGRGFRLLALVADEPPARELGGHPVLMLEDAARRHPDAVVLVAVGRPQARERIVGRLVEAGLRPAAPLIHPSVEYDPASVSFAEGVVVCAGTILTVDIEVQAHVQINLDCTVGHDCVLGAHATLAPGVHISGNARLGERAFLGTGAVTVNGQPGRPLVVGADVVVGAGAVVTRDLAPGVTAVGVPARARRR
ncbi:MAG: NeuD/PglB/VioB family sugar acetyltransferase [Solirubrobacteraceae bacterium]